jgi:hypothetical protein
MSTELKQANLIKDLTFFELIFIFSIDYKRHVFEINEFIQAVKSSKNQKHMAFIERN